MYGVDWGGEFKHEPSSRWIWHQGMGVTDSGGEKYANFPLNLMFRIRENRMGVLSYCEVYREDKANG